MKEITKNILAKEYNIEDIIIDYVNEKEKLIVNKFKEIDEIKEYNQYKVIKAMQDNRLSSTDFYWTTGYGYGDIGRKR